MGLDVDTLFSLLKDGKWHTLKELTQKSGIPHSRIDSLFQFLSDSSFVIFDKIQMKVKLSKTFLSFLEST
jgi:hypothetical protein